MCLARYRIQGSDLASMWLLSSELSSRLEQHFIEKGEKQPLKTIFQSALPLQEYFTAIDNHFRVRAAYLRFFFFFFFFPPFLTQPLTSTSTIYYSLSFFFLSHFTFPFLPSLSKISGEK